MSRKKPLDPDSQGYTNTLLEDINDKFEAVLEATQPIPEMQKQIAIIPELQEKVALIPEMVRTLDATFEEVGRLRIDVEDIKRSLGDINQRLAVLEAAMKLIERNSDEIEQLKKRVMAVERLLT